MTGRIVLINLFALCFFLAPAIAVDLKDGDIIFQTSQSSQSLAIQKATHSNYSHMGIIIFRNGSPFVYEAAGRVQDTPLSAWIKRGKGGTYVVKRLRNADRLLAGKGVARLRKVAESFRGRPYDPYFQWSDDRIYCSELVWKIYQRAFGIEIGHLQKLRDFDLTAPAVQAKLRERYGKAIPLEEKVISPAAMFASEELITVE